MKKKKINTYYDKYSDYVPSDRISNISGEKLKNKLKKKKKIIHIGFVRFKNKP